MTRNQCCPTALLFILLLPLAARAERSALDVYAEADAGGYREILGYSIPEKAAAIRLPVRKILPDYNLEQLRALAYRKALKYNISPRLLESIIWHESGFKIGCLGAAGEFSLGQILPSTWDLMRRSGKIGGNPWLPENNLEAAAMYIRDSYASLTQKDMAYAARMGYQREHLILSLYNGGRGTLNKYVNASEPLPPKLISYVKSVVKIHNSLGKRQTR